MRQFLLKILQFLLFASIMYVILLILWGELLPDGLKKNLNYRIGSYGHMFTRIRDIQNFRGVDILFIGSSHAYRGFDGRIFEEHGFTTFNLGSSSQTPVQSLLLLNRYLDGLNPNVIVMEVYPSSFSSDGVESSLDLIANDRIGPDTLQLAILQNNVKVYNTLIYGVYRQIFNRNGKYSENIIKDDDTYIAGGFVEKKLKYYHATNIDGGKEITWKPRSYQLDALNEIVRLADERNVPLILVQAPVTSYKYQEYSNNDEIDRFFTTHADHYFNFNLLLDLTDQLHFYDEQHMNQEGVRIFNLAFNDLLLNGW